MKLSDLIFESLDDLSSLLFFVFSGLDELPALFDFSSKNGDGIGILLGQFNGSLDPGSVLEDGIIQVFASFNQSFLTFVGSLERSVNLFVLLS